MTFPSITTTSSNPYAKLHATSEPAACSLPSCCEEELFIKMVAFCPGGIKHKKDHQSTVNVLRNVLFARGEIMLQYTG